MAEKFVFLIGPMGAGKTTIGKNLATNLCKAFIDTDQLIEERCGADIPWIFDVEGEQGFRARESRVLQEVCNGQGAVVATGGGIILMQENRRLIKASGLTVYLHATLQQQLERTEKDRNRPLLNNGQPAQVLEELMSVREPLYRELADLVYQTNNRNPRATAAEIAQLISEL